jgi:hypothetical protein
MEVLHDALEDVRFGVHLAVPLNLDLGRLAFEERIKELHDQHAVLVVAFHSSIFGAAGRRCCHGSRLPFFAGGEPAPQQPGRVWILYSLISIAIVIGGRILAIFLAIFFLCSLWTLCRIICRLGVAAWCIHGASFIVVVVGVVLEFFALVHRKQVVHQDDACQDHEHQQVRLCPGQHLSLSLKILRFMALILRFIALIPIDPD